MPSRCDVNINISEAKHQTCHNFMYNGDNFSIVAFVLWKTSDTISLNNGWSAENDHLKNSFLARLTINYSEYELTFFFFSRTLFSCGQSL